MHQINLDTLNTIRARLGKAPLKSWKESKAKLLTTIEKLTAQLPVEAQKKAPKKAPKVNGENVTLANIARGIGLDPKIARAKMRRIEIPAGFEVSRHVYHPQHKQWVVNVLQRDMRKK